MAESQTEKGVNEISAGEKNLDDEFKKPTKTTAKKATVKKSGVKKKSSKKKKSKSKRK